MRNGEQGNNDDFELAESAGEMHCFAFRPHFPQTVSTKKEGKDKSLPSGLPQAAGGNSKNEYRQQSQ